MLYVVFDSNDNCFVHLVANYLTSTCFSKISFQRRQDKRNDTEWRFASNAAKRKGFFQSGAVSRRVRLFAFSVVSEANEKEGVFRA